MSDNTGGLAWHDAPAPDQQAIQKEMAHTGIDASCGDIHVTPSNELRECRRAKKHAPPPASGYATRYRSWYDKP